MAEIPGVALVEDGAGVAVSGDSDGVGDVDDGVGGSVATTGSMAASALAALATLAALAAAATGPAAALDPLAAFFIRSKAFGAFGAAAGFARTTKASMVAARHQGAKSI